MVSSTVNEREAFGIFDGTMLSDASLGFSRQRGNAFYLLHQSGVEHSDWLFYVQRALSKMGVESCEGYPITRLSKGKEYTRLDTLTSPFLTAQYYRWYTLQNGNFRKTVPEDLELTPVTLANWFMGDGGTSWRKGTRDLVFLSLATHGFASREVDCLVELLAKLGITNISKVLDKRCSQGGFFVSTCNSTIISLFLDLIGPYVVPSFSYKIKYPGLRT